MNRKIGWENNVFIEIECVYEKAEQDEQISKMLEQLEENALAQARESCDILQIGGKNVTGEEFDGFSEWDKEAVIATMANAGISSFNADLGSATIVIRFSYLVSRVMACTVFDILNRLEKIDGGIGLFGNQKWTMELQVPIGGKKGLLQWEMLIMKLHPWITSVSETNTNEMAAKPVSREEGSSAAPVGKTMPTREEKKSNNEQIPESEKIVKQPAEKELPEESKHKSFLKKLFRK